MTRSPGRSLEHDLENVWPPPPPAEETELEKALRIQEEIKAAKFSAEIDQDIERSRLEVQAKRGQIRILLLGQAESGKSTILKNFQLQYAPKAFKQESQAWAAVIRLNLVISINHILDRIPNQSNTSRDTSPDPDQLIIEPDNELRKIKMRLRPLHEVEDIMSRQMSADDKTIIRQQHPDAPSSNDRVLVRSGSGWKKLLGVRSQHATGGPDHLNDARQIIDACKEDIAALWNHPAVQAVRQNQLMTLQEQATFFLTDALRVSSRDYNPTMEDILRARLGTLGVEEHRLVVETERTETEYIFYDVGGSRSQRAAWAPYFDDVTVIIFLVPISAFNETLSENNTINRLLDSFQLWRTICSSKLLESITIILLLNKFDLLAEKLDSGILFSKFVTSYKEQSNDAEKVTKYLKAKFAAIHKQFSPKRSLYTHTTCAIDIEATSLVLTRIREILLRVNLAKTDLI